MNASTSSHQSRHYSVLAYGFLLLLVLGSLATLGIGLYRERQKTLDNHLKRAVSLAMLFEHETTQTLQLIESTIRVLADSSQLPLDQTEPATLSRHFEQILRHQPALRSLSLVDATQRVRASSQQANIGLSWSVDGFYPPDTAPDLPTVLRIGHPLPGRDLAEAHQLQTAQAPISNLDPYVIPLIWRLRSGEHVYWILATINPEHWVSRFSRQLQSDSDDFQLVRFDGPVIARSSNQAIGQHFTPQSMLDQIQNEELGTDIGDRLTAFRSSARYAFFVTFSVDKKQVLLDWQRTANWSIIATLLGLGTVTLITSWLVRRINREQDWLNLERSQLQAIYQVLPVGIMLTDPQGRIIDCNPASEHLLGISKAEHLARNSRQHWTLMREDGSRIPPEEFPSTRALTEQITVHDVVLQLVTPQKSLWLSVSASPVPHEKLGVVIAYVDISEQKAQEKALVTARLNAEEANQHKSQFLANMSHEIRTPLNALLGLTQVLERSTLDAEQGAMVHDIRNAGHILLDQLNDVLDFSKIEAGHVELEPRAFDIRHLLSEQDKLLQAAAQEKGLKLNVQPPPALDRPLLGDSGRIAQVLRNMISNSIKFTATGSVTVQIELLERQRDDCQLRFEILDTGIGMPQDKVEQLFEPFTQADSSITRRYGGTGLGLSICKKLVNLMGGAIGAENRPDGGSRFWFELTFPWSDQPIETSPAASSCPAAGPRLPGRRILVVDDNAMNQLTAERMLRFEGAIVSKAENGRESIDLLRQDSTRFDAVLMDVQMPVMDGIETTQMLRCSLGLTELPIIICSAGVQATERSKALACGANAFLAKPIDQDQLVAKLLEVMPPRASGEDPIEARRPPATKPPPAAPSWPEIPGIDGPRMQAQFDGDHEFFLMLLRLLATELRAALAQLPRDLAGNQDSAHQRLHKLRGAAGAVGAEGLAGLSRLLEDALEQAAPTLADHLQQFENEALSLLQSIDPHLA